MNYAELLKNFINRSKLTLDDISLELEKRGLSASKQYLSRLQNGKNPPASDALNRALAEITGGDVDSLLLAGHIEKAPDEIKPILAEASNSGYLVKKGDTVNESSTKYNVDLKDDIETQKKIDFFRHLESDLGLDLSDVEVQKKLKRAAKIIFSSED
ncbi:hypothetical protein MHB77_29280 [Paenibacillus sp. FSL K6-3166]|uniref:hypothetical protein n=1 Tax=unclassified Paenibacillus TaxID=185978 RepID=UPI0015C62DB9|nr:hypothetical protein [Paenibacillus sp. VTT E-133291]